MRKGRNQNIYFRKDYAPARIIAQQKKANSPSAKLTRTLQQTASKTSQAAKRISQNLSAKSSKSRKPATRPMRHATVQSAPSHREPFTWREFTLISMIGVSAAAIAATFVINSAFDPVKRSERELDKIAHDYYIEYLYPHALGKYLDQPEVILKEYVEQGLPNVRLRQLLLYNDGKYADSLSVFSNQYYECDTNKSYVRYYPVEPYGPRDVEIHYGTACEVIGNL